MAASLILYSHPFMEFKEAFWLHLQDWYQPYNFEVGHSHIQPSPVPITVKP